MCLNFRSQEEKSKWLNDLYEAIDRFNTDDEKSNQTSMKSNSKSKINVLLYVLFNLYIFK